MRDVIFCFFKRSRDSPQTNLGYRENMIDILLLENIHPVAKERLESDGFRVDLLTHAPSEAELLKLLPKYQAVGLRSKTEITAQVLEKNPHLLTIGAFCIGTNQIDLRIAC